MTLIPSNINITLSSLSSQYSVWKRPCWQSLLYLQHLEQLLASSRCSIKMGQSNKCSDHGGTVTLSQPQAQASASPSLRNQTIISYLLGPQVQSPLHTLGLINPHFFFVYLSQDFLLELSFCPFPLGGNFYFGPYFLYLICKCRNPFEIAFIINSNVAPPMKSLVVDLASDNKYLSNE